ncbi:MAG: IS5/IS1182 family transposase [Nitrospirae bacterium CG_4_8_14_3_um_filter_70_85]|nr:MAG: IS5/IS1182 family transposase [Nitrospirae bacterium CG_4_8_14_3_um_filter_70_85]
MAGMKNTLRLFEDAPRPDGSGKVSSRGKPRIEEPRRRQGEMRFEFPEDALEPSHPARVLWDVLGKMELGAFSKGCGAVEGRAGRSLKSPRMLLTLWLYALTQAVGSAREIARLVSSDTAYRWIAGNVDISHQKLSQFRVGHGEALNELMTNILATLMNQGLLSLSLVAQDGTRTRAAATAPSFRTYGSLLQCREQAKLHLKAVLATADDPEYTRAQHAARAAAAKDYQERVEAAITTVTELQEQRSPSDSPARASTTDVEARVMKMGDGGFRPAYNVQYAVAGSEMGGPRTIVGVNVTNVGSDMGSLGPMVEQIEQRTGQRPAVLLADGGHAKAEDIAATRRMGVDVLVPPAKTAKTIEQLEAEGADPEVIAWRQRMETDEAKQLYRARAGLAELANAHQKTHHGITQVLVHGAAKVTCVILLNAIGCNLLQHASHLLG